MNFLTGASACARKAIYELLVKEEIAGDHYEERIKTLKEKYPEVNPGYFDILAGIQEMTSDKVHEQSWDHWDSPDLRLILETLKSVLDEMYVEPARRSAQWEDVEALRAKVAQGRVTAASQPGSNDSSGEVATSPSNGSSSD